MTWDEHEDLAIYKVVINHEEQFSIWPADRETHLAGATREERHQDAVSRAH